MARGEDPLEDLFNVSSNVDGSCPSASRNHVSTDKRERSIQKTGLAERTRLQATDCSSATQEQG